MIIEIELAVLQPKAQSKVFLKMFISLDLGGIHTWTNVIPKVSRTKRNIPGIFLVYNLPPPYLPSSLMFMQC